MATIININIGGSPLLPNQQGERAFKYLPDTEPVPVRAEEFDFLSEREFTPCYYLGLTPIPDQVFTRAKNCKKGQACGNSCISLGKTCRKDLTPGQKMAAGKAKDKTAKKATPAKSSKKAKGAAMAGVAIPSGYSKEEQSTLKTAHLKNLYGVAMGEQDTRSLDTIAKQDALLFKSNDNPNQLKKIEKLKKKGLTEPEAHGVAAWIDHNYAPINREIYAPSGSDYGEGAGIRAAQGLHKLKSYTHKEMESLAKKTGEELLPEGQLVRGLSDVSNVEAFLKPYREAVGKDEFKEPTFFATTAKGNLWATSDAQIQYVVKSKADGTGQGKMVDQYKNYSFEGEVVYPPYSRFKVTKVEDAVVEHKLSNGFVSKQSSLPLKYKGIKGDELEPLIPQMLKEKELLKAFDDESSGLKSLKKSKPSGLGAVIVKLKEKKVEEIKQELEKMGYNKITEAKATKYLQVFNDSIYTSQTPFKIYMEEL